MLTVFLMSVLHTTSHVDKRIVPTLLLKDNIVAIKQRGLFTQFGCAIESWLAEHNSSLYNHSLLSQYIQYNRCFAPTTEQFKIT